MLVHMQWANRYPSERLTQFLQRLSEKVRIFQKQIFFSFDRTSISLASDLYRGEATHMAGNYKVPESFLSLTVQVDISWQYQLNLEESLFSEVGLTEVFCFSISTQGTSS